MRQLMHLMGCVIVMNYCASIYCMNSFSLMESVWHNYTIHLQIFHIVSAHWLCFLQMAYNLHRGHGIGDEEQPPPPLPPPTWSWCRWLFKASACWLRLCTSWSTMMTNMSAKDPNRTSDEDINTDHTSTPSTPTPAGPITHARAWKVNHQVSSFLSSCPSCLDLGDTCTLVLIRNQGEDTSNLRRSPRLHTESDWGDSVLVGKLIKSLSSGSDLVLIPAQKQHEQSKNHQEVYSV
jgi:hypothetical protein